MNFNFGGWKDSRAVYSHAFRCEYRTLFGELEKVCGSYYASMLQSATGCGEMQDSRSIMRYDLPAALSSNGTDLLQDGRVIDNEARSLLRSLYPLLLAPWFDRYSARNLNGFREGWKASRIRQDRSNRKAIRALSQKDKLNAWLSSSLCLMDPEVTDFQVLSDGRYVYLFRQGASVAKASPNPYTTDNEAGKPPVDGNLLCERFTLVGTTLSQPLEARYQRSRQKQIPLNDQDTLRAKDIIDNNFYEPTHSLRFVQDLAYGRFAVLRAPTVINDS
ncbi:hypothetical protein N0V84_012725, partial [Fusarium piperis]